MVINVAFDLFQQSLSPRIVLPVEKRPYENNIHSCYISIMFLNKNESDNF